MSFPKTIASTAPLLREKKLSPVEITRACLGQIDKLNPTLNAFITVTAESALAEARAAEEEISRGRWRGPLHGIPVALKDIIDTAGVRTTAASAVHKDRVPAEDAEVVRRLREAGAVIVGKNNLHEFAYGGSSLVSHFGDTHNPHNAAHIAGGSSGGSAAAVVAGMCYAAIGTDTAGSIREPAALCGCVGLKPTYGRVSARGVIPLSTSLDHIGPLASCVEDAAIVLLAIAGYDPGDLATSDIPVADYIPATKSSAKNLRVGVPRAYFFDDLDPEVAASVENAIAKIRTLVAEVKEVTLEIPTDRTLQAAESYAYHAETASASPDLYQPETLRRIRTGATISAVDYMRAQRAQNQTRRNIANIFADINLLITPTMSIPAPAIAELKATPEALRPAELKLLRNTRPFNVWGLPAISIPCGFTKSGLPIGLQIAGAHWREDVVLSLAQAYEQVEDQPR